MSEFQNWRSSWRKMPVPDPERGDTDPATQASIEWMQAAMASLEVPPLPTSLRAKPAAKPSPLRLAIAAALLAIFGLNRISADYQSAPQTPDSLAQESGVPEPISIAALPAGIPATVKNGHIEMRSGPVRLTFLSSPPPTLPPETKTETPR